MTAGSGGADDDMVLRLFAAGRRSRLDPDLELATLLSQADVTATDVAVALMQPAGPDTVAGAHVASPDADMDGPPWPSVALDTP